MHRRVTRSLFLATALGLAAWPATASRFATPLHPEELPDTECVGFLSPQEATGGSAPAAVPAQTAPVLIDGLGYAGLEPDSRNAEARRWFAQGVRLVWAFDEVEAIRAFQQAQQLDPTCAMCFFGEAWARGPTINLQPRNEELAAARTAARRAQALGASLSPRDRLLVDAMLIRTGAGTEFRNDAYASFMETQALRHPEDDQINIMAADARMVTWPDGPQPAGTLAQRFLERVLARNPNHGGAIHYYIHLTDWIDRQNLAVPYAERLGRVAPAASHLVHMPSHIYMLVGDYKAAADANVIAAKVDKDYIDNEHVKGAYPMLYFHHNLHFIAAARGMEGRYGDAREAAARLTESLHSHAGDIPGFQNFITEYFGMYPLLTAVRFHDWKTVLAAREPGEDLPISRGLRHYARGAAFAAQGDAKGATAERESLAKIIESLPADSRYGNSPAKEVLSVGLSIVDARIAARNGDLEKAVSDLKAAVETQDKLAYNEPADWHYPVRESLGAALLTAGPAAVAAAVFRADLEKNPRGGRSLFGLVQALQAQGKTDEAALVRQELDAAWRTAEIELNLDTM
jgi:hypothetical protein